MKNNYLGIFDKPIKMFGVGDEYDTTEYAICWYCRKPFMVYFDKEDYNILWIKLDTGETIQRCSNCKEAWNVVRD